MPDSADTTIAPLHPGPLVLVVVDDHAERLGMRRMILGLGYTARSCRRGLDALRFLQSHPQLVSVLVADLGMPGMDGGELVERALDLDRALRVVLMADLQDPLSAELLTGYRDLPLLLKPIRIADLHGALMTLVGPPVRPRCPPRSVRRDGGRADGPRATMRCEAVPPPCEAALGHRKEATYSTDSPTANLLRRFHPGVRSTSGICQTSPQGTGS